MSPFGMSTTKWPIVPAPDDRWVWSVWWNESWKRKLKYLEKICPISNFVNHESHMMYPGIKPGPPQWEASDQLPEHCPYFTFKMSETPSELRVITIISYLFQTRLSPACRCGVNFVMRHSVYKSESNWNIKQFVFINGFTSVLILFWWFSIYIL
jgi:hypothetical protein